MLLSFSLPLFCTCKINKNMICQSKLRASLVPRIITGTRLHKKQFFFQLYARSRLHSVKASIAQTGDCTGIGIHHHPLTLVSPASHHHHHQHTHVQHCSVVVEPGPPDTMATQLTAALHCSATQHAKSTITHTPISAHLTHRLHQLWETVENTQE